MRAICLFICLTLARDIAGSIFRKQYYPHMESLIIQPLEYMDQYQQQQLQQQPQEHQQSHHHYHHHENNQQWQQSQENRPKSNSRSSESDSQETNENPKYLSNKRSNSQESKEKYSYVGNKEHSNEYGVPTEKDKRNWNNELFTDVKDKTKPVYGDVIVWNSVRTAVGPRSSVKDQKEIETIYKDAYDNMKHLSEEDRKKLHETYQAVAQADNEDTYLNATQLIKKYHYTVEEHIVKTDDGYYLTLFHILSQKREPRIARKRPQVFLMHGLLGSADDWLLMGPDKSLAYLLSSAGYDVWLGNTRGNKYSRRHVIKHPAQPEFWQFSTDEIALQDLPAMIDYVLKTSENEKLYYVGHAQGTTAFFALAATRPEYNDKIAMMYAMSPMAYVTNTRSPLFRMIAPNSPFYDRLRDQIGYEEFNPSKEIIQTVGGEMCEKEIGCKNVCSNINFVMAGVNIEDLDVSLIPVILGHLPAGGSTRQIKQYGQAVASQEFRKYDFGFEINQKVYGDRQPPSYKLDLVRAPVALYYSEADWLAHPKDVERLQKELPQVKDFYKIEKEQFMHMDFQFSKYAPEVVYKRLIESVEKNYPY